MPETLTTVPQLIVPGTQVQAKFNNIFQTVEYVSWDSDNSYPRVRYEGRTVPRRIYDFDGNLINNNRCEGYVPADGEVPAMVTPDAPVSFASPEAAFHVTVDERFVFIEKFVTMIARGKSNSLIITGSGGLGKTFTVLATLAELDLTEDHDFAVVRGYSTARAVFDVMEKNKSKIIIFDDCDSVLDDKVSVNLLKGALDSSKRRSVSWLTSTDGVNKFDFTGQIIFLSNKKLSQIPQPLLSRAQFVDVSMTPDEKIGRLRTIIRNVRTDLPIECKTEILDLMDKNRMKIGDLNIRTFLKACEVYDGCGGEGWQQMATYMMLTQTV